MIIAIDVTGTSAGVAWCDGEEQGWLPFAGARPSTALLPALDICLKMARPDKIGVVTGPGSFTGIRTGIATVLGLKTALDVDVVGLNKFELLSAQEDRAGVLQHFLVPGRGDRLFYGRMQDGVFLEAPQERSIETLEMDHHYISTVKAELPNLIVRNTVFAQAAIKAVEKGLGDPHLKPLYIRPADTRSSPSFIEKLLAKRTPK